MAGDWIKFETGTPDKPEVWAVAATLNIDPDAVVGKLLRVWAWFDQHTEDGNAVSVTKMLLDRQVGVPGFCDAVIQSGWMHEHGGCISLPNFDRHNGKTAKKRAVTAKRVAAHKESKRSGNDDGNGTGNADSVTDALPKEEKRRDIKNNPPISPQNRKPAKRATQLPDDFEPNDTNRRVAAEEGVSIHDQLPQFRDHHRAKGSTMKDWHAALNTWLRNVKKFGGGARSSPGRHPTQPSTDYRAGVTSDGRLR
ncbi:hypothetical protein [Alloalcanivorax xenomutans]